MIKRQSDLNDTPHIGIMGELYKDKWPRYAEIARNSILSSIAMGSNDFLTD